MIVLHVSVQVKPEHVKEFLEVLRYDAEHSETDEPGCLRFDLIQDRDDPNRFYSPSLNTSQLAARMKARRTLCSLGEGGWKGFGEFRKDTSELCSEELHWAIGG